MVGERSHFTRGTAAALISVVFLSTTGIFIRHLTLRYGLPALVLAVWRDLFVVMTLAPILAIARPQALAIRRDQIGYLVAYGFILALFNAFWTQSVVMNGAAVATVLVYSSAAFTALLGWRLLGESLQAAKIIAVVLGLGGCLLVAGPLEAGAAATVTIGAAGILIGMLSGLSYALYSLMGRSAGPRGLRPWTCVVYAFGFAACFLILANLVGGGRLPGAAGSPRDFLWLGRAWSGWLVLFILAAVPTVAGFGLYNVSLSHLPSSVANLILTLEPVLTAAIAYVLLGERLSLLQGTGGLLIVAGVVCLQVSEGRRAGRSAEPTGASGHADARR